MATNYIAPTWRMPENTNKDKLSNYSLEFNGTDEYITFPQTDFKGGSGTVSYSFWAKPNTYAGTSNYGYFLSGSTRGGIAYSEGGNTGGLTPGEIYLYDMTNLGAVVTTTGCILDENIWNHIVIVFNTGNIVQFYKNNSLVSTLTGITSFISTWNAIGTWNRAMGPAHYASGALSEFLIFNYALAQSQVTYLYNLNNPMAITGAKPVAYWPLGDNSNPARAEGYPNLSFRGSVFNFIPNDHIELGDDSSLRPTSQLSVSAWVKDTGAGAGAFPTIIGNVSTSANKGGWILAKYQNKWRFYLDTTGNSGWAVAESNGTVVINSWQHLCATWDGSTVIMYLNGQAQTTTASASQIVYLADTTTAIGEYRAGTDYFGGEMSNIALLDTALTPAQVTTLYNNGAPGDISSLSPIAWYKLDSSEIFNSTSTEWSVDNNAYPSVYKSSLNFNGSSNYIDCGTGSRFDIDQITISAWVNLSSSITSTKIIAGIRNTNSGSICYQLQNQGSGSKFRFVIRQEDGTYVDATADDIHQYNTWYHVVGIADGSNVKLYVNGILQTDVGPYDGTIESPNQNFNIGRQSSPPAYHWSGELSNISVFNTVLTGPQVETLYNNGTPESSISHSPVSWWKLDNTTTGVQDSAGSNNGTNNGAIEYAGFVNALAGESVGMDSSNLVQSNLDSKTPYSNYSVKFNGSTQYFGDGDTSGIFNGSTKLSISGWINVDPGETISILSGQWEGSGRYQHLIRWRESVPGFQFYLRINNTSKLAVASVNITSNTWYHMVGTWDGTNMKIYLNGDLKQTVPASGNLESANGENFIGKYQNQVADGLLSNIAFWKDTALTEGEILEIYNTGVSKDLNNFSGTAPDRWYPMDERSTYFNGSTLTIRDVMNNNDMLGYNNTITSIEGNAPGSSTNGTGTNLDISNLKGDMSNSTKNSYSINMADYGDPNSQGLTPANSGRTTDVPGVVDPGGQFSPFNTSTTPRSFEGDACMDNNDGQFYTEEFPPQPVIPFVGSIVYTDAAGTGYPEEGYYSQFIEEYGMKVYYLIGANGEVTGSDMCI